MIWAAVVALALVALFAWQDGVHPCQDGARYCSGTAQPTPFNRRFCSWPPRLLMVVSWASFIALAATLGDWKDSLLFMTLPGVWFCVIHPTTVDGPAMLLAWLSALAAQRGHYGISVAASCASGAIHERGPVFAALYAWHWLPCVGLAIPLAMGLLKTSAAPNHQSSELADRLVGHTGVVATAQAHKPYVDLLGESGLVWSVRGLPVMAAALGVDWRAWPALGVAFASRLIGTDTSRFLMWAAPALIAPMPDPPMWMVALQVLSFRRAAQ